MHNVSAQLSEKVKWPYFKDFTQPEKDTIKKYWMEYFTKDITPEFYPSIPVKPIWLDTYGGVYPDFDLLKDVSFKPFKKHTFKERKSYQLRFSIYNLFISDVKNQEVFIRNIRNNNLSDVADSVEHLFKNYLVKKLRTNNSQLTSFYEGWNRQFNKVKYEEFKNTLARSGKTKIMFFNHGFNVPYSLAVVQSQKFYKYVSDSFPQEMNKTLFVPVLWTSGKEKECELDSSEFSLENSAGVFNGGLKNKRQFKYYGNHCYSDAITMRELINHLDNSTEVYYVAHSMGSIMATATFFNTFSRYDYSECGASWNWVSQNFGNLSSKDFKAKYIREHPNRTFGEQQVILGFKNTPLPTQKKIRVFLSAPAIPGQSTFCDLFESKFNPNTKNWDIQFYSTANIQDPMLTKTLIPFLNVIGFANAYNHGSTSLGANFNHEIEKVAEQFENISGPKFRSQSVQVSDHDIFVYMNEPRYLNFVNRFMEERKPKLKIDVEFEREVKRLENSYLLYRKAKKKDQTRVRSFKLIKDDLLYSDFNLEGHSLAELLFELEERNRNYSSNIVSDSAQRLINSIDNPYYLALLERSLSDMDVDPQHYVLLERLVEQTGQRMKLIDKKAQNFYTYQTQTKKLVKFIHLRIGNDLFQFNTISKNYDRDLTGSLNFEIATDYLNLGRKRPLKSYQILGYGFDVYTPQFNDSVKFKKFNDYDSLDRPHGSFQYAQWAKKGLSRTNRMRWSTAFKLGIIGGKIGYVFQTVLHQDISSSLRPKGWDAQIAKGGRLGTSIETRHEYLLAINRLNNKSVNPNSFFKFYLVPNLDLKFGSFMTNASLGLTLTNKDFTHSNHHFINQRKNFGRFNIWDNLMYRINFTGTYVKHNTMLEGFGYWNTSETNPKKVDEFTPKSAYILQSNQVRRFIYYVNSAISYSARNFTIFYNHFIYSPETTLGNLNAKDPRRMNIDVGHRLHVVAEIGMNFAIK